MQFHAFLNEEVLNTKLLVNSYLHVFPDIKITITKAPKRAFYHVVLDSFIVVVVTSKTGYFNTGKFTTTWHYNAVID